MTTQAPRKFDRHRALVSLQTAGARVRQVNVGATHMMSIERIEHALKEIEESLPSGPAQVRFDVYGGGVDESFIRGSRAGIARLGIFLIRAACKPEQKKSINGAPQIEGDLDGVIHRHSDVKFDWIELSDDLEIQPEVQSDTRRRLRRESLLSWIFAGLAGIAYVVWRLR